MQLRRVWSKVDADGSGGLDLEEIASVMEMMHMEDTTPAKIMEEMGSGGEVGLAEFSVWFPKQRRRCSNLRRPPLTLARRSKRNEERVPAD